MPWRRTAAPADGRSPRGIRRRLLIAAATLVTVFAAATAAVLVWPQQGAPARVDAIVMLAGPGDRLPVALALARQHRAPVLVVSQGWQGYGGPCPAPTPAVRTICFDPNPGNTRGEAEHVASLARRFGWRSILLVTTRPQGTRARLIMQRCYSDPVYLNTAPIALRSWPYQIAYGWAALFKAIVLVRSC